MRSSLSITVPSPSAVRRFDGFVAKYMGDGILIYFGYPRAHEDDVERSIRAGLAVIDAVGRLDIGSVKLRARVGIATGLVVVGDLDRRRLGAGASGGWRNAQSGRPAPGRRRAGARWRSRKARGALDRRICSNIVISALSPLKGFSQEGSRLGKRFGRRRGGGPLRGLAPLG